jgi:hypothetical protein
MKTNSLLLLASFAVCALSANAASTQIDSELLVLPKFVVTAPRYQPIERQINASLDELRQQANTPAPIASEPATLKAKAQQDTSLVQAGQNRKNNRVAKL